MTIVREFAPAKINLTLEVQGRRADGNHEINSLVAFADVGDVIILDTSKPVGVTASGPFAHSIAGANLVETTLRLIAEAGPELRLGAVHLEKNLPIAAGIGGGSADAAAVIRAVRKANPEHIDCIDWQRIAMRIGADVPVCLVSSLAWMRGVGEIVAPLTFAEPVGVAAVILNPMTAVPHDKTAQVFRAYAARPEPNSSRPENHPAIRNRHELLHVICSGRNDLAAAAVNVVPAIGEVLQAIRVAMQPGGRVVRMSGAGPTCFSIFDDDATAKSAAATLQRTQPDWWVKAVALS